MANFRRTPRRGHFWRTGRLALVTAKVIEAKLPERSHFWRTGRLALVTVTRARTKNRRTPEWLSLKRKFGAHKIEDFVSA